MTDFYVTLISNTSGRNNTISDFTTYLPNRLQFNNDYEVALVSFSYHHSWLHFDYGEANFMITKTGGDKEIYKVPPGHYEDNQSFINTLNSLLPVVDKGTRFEYEEKTNKVTLIVENGDTVTLNELLAGVLGFDSKSYQAHSDTSPINILVNEAYLKITDNNSQVSTIDIPPGSYENYNSITNTINERIQLELGNLNTLIPVLEYVQDINRVILTMARHEWFIFDEHIGDLLGFIFREYEPVDEEGSSKEFAAQRTLTSINDLNLDTDSIITLENRETNDAYTITIPSGYYYDIFALLRVMNAQIRKAYFDQHPITRFEYNESLNKMKLIITDNVNDVQLNSGLADILGFDITRYNLHTVELLAKNESTEQIAENQRPIFKHKHVGKNAIDLNLTRHNLFVYSDDLVTHSLIGDGYYPLLGIIPTNDDNFSHYVVHTFPDPSYFKVQNNQLTKIRISIKDDSANHIKFLSGRTVLFLHFRPIEIQ